MKRILLAESLSTCTARAFIKSHQSSVQPVRWKIQLYLHALIIGAVLFIATQPMYAQSADILNDTITFTCSGFQDRLSKEASGSECQFIIYRNQKVVWIQDGGEVVFDLSVSRTEGRWKNVSNDGAITYRFRFDNKGDGRLTISRKNNTYKILFDLRGLENGDILNEYDVTEVEVN